MELLQGTAPRWSPGSLIHPEPQQAQGWAQEPPHPREWRVLTLEIVTFAIHEDVVHEHHAEHAGVDVEVAEDQGEVGWLQGEEDLGFMASPV